MRSILFELGSLQVYSFGFMIAIGFIVGLYFALLEAKRRGINPDIIYNLTLGLLVLGVLGARLYYIFAYNFEYYLINPIEIIMIQHGGLSIHGGILGGLFFGIWFIRKNRLKFWVLADTVAPSVVLGTAIGRVGCDVFGEPMNKLYVWGVERGGQLLHPTQAYEFLLNYLIFFFLWRFRLKTRFDGQLFLLYVILYAGARGVVEFFRSNPMVGDFISVAHLTSLIFIGAAVVGYYILSQGALRHFRPYPQHENTSALVLEQGWIQIGLILLTMGLSLAVYYGVT